MASYTSTPIALKRVQYDPAASGDVPAQAFFASDLVNDSDPSDVIAGPWQQVAFTIPEALANQIKAAAEAAAQ